MSKKLTPKQEIFCKEYIIDFNATRSAVKAGYSEKTAYKMGAENLIKPQIQSFIQAEMEKRSKRTEITADMVVNELAKTAFIQESDFYHDSGDVKKLSELSDDQKAALSSYGFKSIHIGDGEYVDVPVFKAQDKIKSLELLGRHFGLFNDKLKVEGEFNLSNFVKTLHDEES